MAIPNIIDVGIPDSGIDIDDDITEAILKPALAVMADKATPGSIDGGDEGVCCLVEVENEEDPRICLRAHTDLRFPPTSLSSSLLVVGSKHEDSLICGWKDV